MHDVIVAIGRWHGGGMQLAPEASQDDGLFDNAHRRREQARLPLDSTKALQRQVPLAPEGRPRPQRDARDRCGRAAAGRGRRGADRDDTGALRGRSPRLSASVSRRSTRPLLASSVRVRGARSARRHGCADRARSVGVRSLHAVRGRDERRAANRPRALVPLFHASWQPAGVGADTDRHPARAGSDLVRDRRRGGVEAPRAGVGAAWFGAVAVEFALRHVLTRPALYRDGVHITAFDSSWPSGHALRCAIVAAALAVAWPRARTALGGVARRLGRAPRARRLPHADRCCRRAALALVAVVLWVLGCRRCCSRSSRAVRPSSRAR